ncbi:MAG: histidine kinase [Gemmatimonadales bacterium]|jgi:signal transduction histidine kinase
MTRTAAAAGPGIPRLLGWGVLALGVCGLIATSQTLLSWRAVGTTPDIAVPTLVAFNLAKWFTWLPAVLPVLLADRFLRRREAGRGRRIAALVGLGIVAIFLHSAGVVGVDLLFFGNEIQETAGQVLLTHFRTVLLVEVIACFGLVAAWISAVNAWEVRSARAETAALEASLARAELQSLMARLQPHFLFNSLQAIAAVNARDPVAGERALVELADLYRNVLSTTGRQVQRLDAEIDFLRRYTSIQELRMPDRLRVRFDIASEVEDALVPHLILQPLVENAVEHGVAPGTDAAEIRVEASASAGRLRLSVRDTGVGLSTGGTGNAAGEGTGLDLTRERLAALYGDAASFELRAAAPGAEARLVLPLERMP